MTTPVRNRAADLFNGCLVPTFVFSMLLMLVTAPEGESETDAELKLAVLAVGCVAVAMLLPAVGVQARRLGGWVYRQFAAEFQGSPKLALPGAEAVAPLRSLSGSSWAALARWIWDSADAFYARRGVPWFPIAFTVACVYESALLAAAFLFPWPFDVPKPEDLVLTACVYGTVVVAAPPVLALVGPWVGRISKEPQTTARLE
ncbi:hypothetical protein EPO15_14810 [bacterium]|nr:MAG: hypothetical protein EPO15_14810 [bacterium]